MKNDKIEFASFAYPKPLFSIPRGKPAQRLAAKKAGKGYKYEVGGYYSPKHCPLECQDEKGRGFYLEAGDGGQGFSLRWEWADEVEGVNISHTGWFCDGFQDEKIRGLVFRLPKGRGFLAGWSMGESMASEVEHHIYETARAAALAADGLAESVAEKEREYQEEEERKRQEEEEREQAEELNAALCSMD